MTSKAAHDVSPGPISRHNVEIQRNREAWERKPALREVYRSFHRRIAARIDRSIPGLIVELGSGMGAIKEVIPDCMTTDLFQNPWLDRQENAYKLSFTDGSVSHLILFDVWHHLRYPGTALREFARVLAPGGRLILMEPATSWIGRLVYGLMHPEPLGLGQPISWEAPNGWRPEEADYFAAQGAATRIFWRGEDAGRLAGWRLVEAAPFTSFEYVTTGGFSGPEINNAPLRNFVRRVAQTADSLLAGFPRAFAVRLLVVLEKPRTAAHARVE